MTSDEMGFRHPEIKSSFDLRKMDGMCVRVCVCV